VMPSGGCRVNCNLCSEEQYTRNMNRHLFRAHQIGEWKTGYSAVQSEVTSRASSPPAVVNCPDQPSRRSQAVLPNTEYVPNLNAIDNVHVPVLADTNCHPPVSSCMPKTVGLQQSTDVHLVNLGNRDGIVRNSSHVESDMSDNRTVVSRVQRVSCVCEPDVSGDSFECDTPHLMCSDSMNWLVRDAVLCMLRRDEDNNMAALKRYLMYRFPHIPEQFRDVIIVSAFTAA